MYPWLDRAGRFSSLKFGVFLCALAPGLWLAMLFAMDMLGPKPITTGLHETGSWTVRFLLISLAVTPARRIADLPRLILVRRLLGLTALAYLVIHFALYIVDQAFDLAAVASEIVLRFYLTIGFAALVGFAVLGVTSTDGMVKRLGATRWNQLHQLVFPLTILGLWHFFLQSKRDVSEAALMAGLFTLLIAYRAAVRFDWRLGALTLALLAFASCILTALIEAGWYALATRVPSSYVLAANIDFAMPARPSWYVLGAGLAVALIGAIRARAKAPDAGRGRARPA